MPMIKKSLYFNLSRGMAVEKSYVLMFLILVGLCDLKVSKNCLEFLSVDI